MDQVCPICRSQVNDFERYPRALCQNCTQKLTDANGRAIYGQNTHASGGFEARYRDNDEIYPSHTCFIKGVECHIDEAHLGGIVAQPTKI